MSSRQPPVTHIILLPISTSHSLAISHDWRRGSEESELDSYFSESILGLLYCIRCPPFAAMALTSLPLSPPALPPMRHRLLSSSGNFLPLLNELDALTRLLRSQESWAVTLVIASHSTNGSCGTSSRRLQENLPRLARTPLRLLASLSPHTNRHRLRMRSPPTATALP